MQESWVTLTPEQQADLDRFVVATGWRVVSQVDLPIVFPPSLRSKIDTALAITAPTSTGGTYVVISAIRPDRSDLALDVEPFGLIVDSSGPSGSGVFLHHGEWEGRTQPAPESFWQCVENSGVGDYFFVNPPQGKSQGALEDLPAGHSGAFSASVRAMRTRRDKLKSDDA